MGLTPPAFSIFDARQFDKLASVIRVCSVKVEKKHLLGQECRSIKKRGRAPTCRGLQLRTYHKFVIRTHTKQHAKAKNANLSSNAAKKIFGRSLANLKVASRGRMRGNNGQIKHINMNALTTFTKVAECVNCTALYKLYNIYVIHFHSQKNHFFKNHDILKKSS